MPASAQEIGFLAVTPDHYPLLAEWLRAPHMQEWWGDPDEELGFIRDMVEGRDTTQPFLFTLDGVPIGYIQAWFIGHHQNESRCIRRNRRRPPRIFFALCPAV